MRLLNPKEQQTIINCLNQGEILILPTDTIYGLSGRVDAKLKVKINRLKQADQGKQLIILINSLAMAEGLVKTTPDSLSLLTSSEPTTVIYLSKTTPEQTLALRLVKRPDIQAIIDQTGPLYSTSVNLHHHPFLQTKKSLEEFDPSLRVFYVGELNGQPSRIYNSLTRKYER